MWFGPMLLAGLGLVMCLFCDRLSYFILSPAVSAVRAEPVQVQIALWHGLNPVFGLSVLTYLLGAGVFLAGGILRRYALKLHRLAQFGPLRWYGVCLEGTLDVARLQTRVLQSGYLRFYILIVVLWVTTSTGYALFRQEGLLSLEDRLGLTFFEAILAGLVASAAAACALFRSRLASALSLGVVGYGVALLFIRFGAPDLAMTQFMIETLTVLLIVLVFYRLPRYARLSRKTARFRDLAVALGAGALMTTLVLLALSGSRDTHLSDYYAETSKPLAHGANVVNVILVDFRALDTLGEVTVLTLAGIGVVVLLRLRGGGKEGR
jgi:multicomponent Na+:H+ antiporter subunit A